MKTALCATDQHQGCGGVVFDGEADRPCGCDCHGITEASPSPLVEDWLHKIEVAKQARECGAAMRQERCPRCDTRLRPPRADDEDGCWMCGWVRPPAVVLDYPAETVHGSARRRVRSASHAGSRL